MARTFSDAQRKLLRAPSIAVNVFLTFFLDDGTYRFCDDVYDFTFDGATWIGANTLLGTSDIRSGDDMNAEGVTLTLDGNRMSQAGIQDPGKILRQLLDYITAQRRVDMSLGFRYPNERDILLMIPVFAGKINGPRLIDGRIDPHSGEPGEALLEIQLDSLSMRYQRATWRTRSHDDQLMVDPTDNFYSYTADSTYNEKNLYWGKKGPANSAAGGTSVGWGSVDGSGSAGGGGFRGW